MLTFTDPLYLNADHGTKRLLIWDHAASGQWIQMELDHGTRYVASLNHQKNGRTVFGPMSRREALAA